MTPEATYLIKTDFASFVRKAFKHLHGKPLGPEQYIDLLCHKLDKLYKGKTRRLLINMPPRHLKTFIASICFSAWTLANNSRMSIMIVTYNDELAADISRNIRALMQAPWYHKIFKTRLSSARLKVDDFKTTDGGGVYAVSSNGALAGHGGDLIIFDDPLDLKDWNNAKEMKRVSEVFHGKIMSRFNTPRQGRALVIAHRLNENDLSSELGNDRTWTKLRLPLIATRSTDHDLGYTIWHRKKGDLLRPDAFTKTDIRRMKKRQATPPFYLYYQQGLGKKDFAIKEEYFPSFSRVYFSPSTIVLSVDPAQKDGSDKSYNVIQVWSPANQNYYLLNQWREQCGFSQLLAALRQCFRLYKPSATLIEDAANGCALIAEARRRSLPNIISVTPDGRSKSERLQAHMGILRQQRILTPDDAHWRSAFVSEFVAFPGDFTDQVDATTQFLDYMAANPRLEPAAKRALGVASGSFGPITPQAQPLRPEQSGGSGFVAVARSSRRPF